MTDYPRGHLHRVWLVLGAIDALESPTLVNITNATGFPKPTVNDALKKLIDGQVVGVSVEKQGAEYRIAQWLDIRQSVSDLYTETCCKVGQADL